MPIRLSTLQRLIDHVRQDPALARELKVAPGRTLARLPYICATERNLLLNDPIRMRNLILTSHGIDGSRSLGRSMHSVGRAPDVAAEAEAVPIGPRYDALGWRYN